MSSPRDPDDIDPTGIRDLLAALPDPGPMPEDLVRRIEARLEVEQAHRDASAPVPSPGATVARAADHVFDLAAERGHRRPGRTVTVLGAAAAGLLVTSVALTQLVGSDGGLTTDTAAVYPSLTRGHDAVQDGDEAGAAGQDDVEPLAEAMDDGAGPVGAGADGAGVDGHDTAGGGSGEAGGADLQPDSAREDADDLLGSVLSAPDPELGGRLGVLPHLGEITDDDLVPALVSALEAEINSYGARDLTLEEARSCWQVLDAPRTYEDYIAARADLGSAASSSSVVALLALTGDGSGHAWALPESCTGGARVTPVTGPHEMAEVP